MITPWRCSSLAIALLAFSPLVALAEEGAPSKSTLEAMGLSSMRMMSDADALTVRGLGAVAWGHSHASINGVPADANSSDGYLSFGRYAAGGGSYSFARKRTTHTTTVDPGPGPPVTTVHTRSVHVSAGGHSWAYSL